MVEYERGCLKKAVLLTMYGLRGSDSRLIGKQLWKRQAGTPDFSFSLCVRSLVLPISFQMHLSCLEGGILPHCCKILSKALSAACSRMLRAKSAMCCSMGRKPIS